MSRTRGGAAAVLAAALLWGTMGPVAALYPAGSALGVASWRLVIGAGALLVAVTVARGWRPWTRADRGPALSGVVAKAAYSGLYFPAVALSGVAVATVVSIGAAPLMAGATHAVRGGRVDRRWLVATVVGIVGMALVVLPGAHSPGSWLGVVLALLAAAAYSWQAHAINQLSPRHGAVEIVAVLFGGAAVVFVPIAIASASLVTASAASALGVVYLGLFTTSIAYALFAFGIPHVGAPTAVTLSLVEPVAATALAALVAGQVPAPVQLLGIVVTLAAVALLTLVPRGSSRPV